MRIQSLKESAALVAKGFVMGSADVVPGVSGGTMALLIGLMIGSLPHALNLDTLLLALLIAFVATLVFFVEKSSFVQSAQKTK